jgi:hypothetical protein
MPASAKQRENTSGLHFIEGPRTEFNDGSFYSHRSTRGTNPHSRVTTRTTLHNVRDCLGEWGLNSTNRRYE